MNVLKICNIYELVVYLRCRRVRFSDSSSSPEESLWLLRELRLELEADALRRWCFHLEFEDEVDEEAARVRAPSSAPVMGVT